MKPIKLYFSYKVATWCFAIVALLNIILLLINIFMLHRLDGFDILFLILIAIDMSANAIEYGIKSGEKNE